MVEGQMPLTSGGLEGLVGSKSCLAYMQLM